jgi:predicted GNAT family N-acyltransferase
MFALEHFTAADPRMAACRAIREDVFCREQNVAAELEWDGKDDACTHFLIRSAGQTIGTGRLRPLGEGTFKIERVAVLAQHRRSGAGQALMEYMLTYARAGGAQHIVLHAQAQAARFYELLGFVAEGEPFDEAGIAHVAMRRGYV